MDNTTRNPSEQDIKAWYNRRYADRGLGSMRTPEAYQVFLDALDARPGMRLLDIACGTGFLLRAAAQRGLRTFGTDISEEAVKTRLHRANEALRLWLAEQVGSAVQDAFRFYRPRCDAVVSHVMARLIH